MLQYVIMQCSTVNNTATAQSAPTRPPTVPAPQSSSMTGVSALHEASQKGPLEHAGGIEFDINIDINGAPNQAGLELSKQELDTQHPEIQKINLFTIKFPSKKQLISFTDLGANVLDLRLGGDLPEDKITDSPLLTNPKIDKLSITPIRGLNPISSPPGRIEDEILFPVNDAGKLDKNGPHKTKSGIKISDFPLDKNYPRNGDMRIHGFLFKKKWKLEHVKTNANQDLQVSYIYDTRADDEYKKLFGEMIYRVKYTLSNRNSKPEFLTEMSVENVSQVSWLAKLFGKKPKDAFPIGLQSHPYFNAKSWRLSASKYLELSANNLPTGKLLDLDKSKDLNTMQPTSQAEIDHPYTALKPGPDHLVAEFIRPDDKVLSLRWDTRLAPFAVVYNGKAKEGQVCIEPGTSAPNASQLQFNPNCKFDPKPSYLKPGESQSMWWSVDLGGEW
jgi:galactose mutarotase-like enzyme